MEPSPKRIILVEDDPLQADWLAEQVIWKTFKNAEIRYYESEYALQKAVDEDVLKTWFPQYAVIDLLIRYYSPQDLVALSPKPSFEQLPEAIQAGIRCREKLLNKFPGIKPVIITVFDLDIVPKDIKAISKRGEELKTELIKFLKS